MKNFFIAAISMAMVSSAFAQNQPQGTWYLGTANATDVVNIFANGVDMTPSIGYAVADNFVLGLDLNTSRLEEVYTGTEIQEDSVINFVELPDGTILGIPGVETTETAYTETYTTTRSLVSLTASYFFGDNYFAKASLGTETVTDEYEYSLDADLNDDFEDTGVAFAIGLGKFIPVRENWYLTPQVNYATGTVDYEGRLDGLTEENGRGLSMSIGFGARF